MNKRLSAQPTASIELLQSHSLPSLVQRHLENMILAGQLIPGSKLTEIPLAGQLGVSRGPVREAFRGLEEKGLVRVERNRGVFVRTITSAEADDIYEVRQAIEELIVRKLAAAPDRVMEAGLEEVLAKAGKFAEKGDFARCHALNIEFHDRLAALTGNAALLDHYRRLANELSLFRHRAHAKIRDASSLRASVADHRALLAAIAAGDRRLAVRLIREHLEASRARLQRLLADREDSPG
ncbi:MAG: FCD domain-containing protein [Sulfuritalea sp.]|nr:FCD domain-containing protein [Sulfuritalea sp.]